MASLLRSPTLVMPLQKRASTDLISHENRISGYSDDIAAAAEAEAVAAAEARFRGGRKKGAEEAPSASERGGEWTVRGKFPQIVLLTNVILP